LFRPSVNISAESLENQGILPIVFFPTGVGCCKAWGGQPDQGITHGKLENPKKIKMVIDDYR
jgi:hypothetical protein